MSSTFWCVTRDSKICVGKCRTKSTYHAVSEMNISCLALTILADYFFYCFRNKIYANDEWFIDNVIPLTSSLFIARIVHYILYTIKAMHSDIQSILRAVRTSTFIMYIIKSFDNFVIHTLAYIISQSSAISTDFNFHRTLRVTKKYFSGISNN